MSPTNLEKSEPMMKETESSELKKRGFGSMSPERQREIASKGGKAVDPKKRAYSVDRELAIEAGKKGGISVKPENRLWHRHPEIAREMGRRGGCKKAKGKVK